jgi:hypothetical protein
VRVLLHAALDALDEAGDQALELEEPPEAPAAGQEQKTKAA